MLRGLLHFYTETADVGFTTIKVCEKILAKVSSNSVNVNQSTGKVSAQKAVTSVSVSNNTGNPVKVVINDQVKASVAACHKT